MTEIAKIDKNFEVGKTINQKGIRFYDSLEAPFVISGLMYGEGRFFRMPPEIASTVSDGVKGLNFHTAGGRLRFRTNSPYVAISVNYNGVGKMPHFAYCGSIGFDLYADNVFVKTFCPDVNIVDKYEGILNVGKSDKVREIVINFPLYSGVKSLYVGLDENATVEAPSPYINEKPVVYYGSSITQGGCASRPGSAYQSPVSREFNLDFVNLGFSGSAKAEDAIIEYIKGLDMSIFVYDYDHNAPSADYLEATHAKMFSAIREAQPNLPIIMMSRPLANRNADDERRLNIVKTTYVRAKALGDKEVYFLDGDDLTALCGNEGTVDNCHPTDYGFASMAHALIDLIKTSGLLEKIK